VDQQGPQAQGLPDKEDQQVRQDQQDAAQQDQQVRDLQGQLDLQVRVEIADQLAQLVRAQQVQQVQPAL
jgi:hypothetical protein